MSATLRAFATAILVILHCFATVNSEVGQLTYCNPTAKAAPQSFVYVSTLDGKISALDLLTGELKWSLALNDKPLLSSNIHHIELKNNGQWVRLIPSLKGAFYKYDGDNVEFMPVTAEQLLESTPHYLDDLMFSGGKETHSYGILGSTGKVIYECNIKGCTNSTDADKYHEEEILVVQRYQLTVRAVDAQTGVERWNFSVGQHEVSLVRSPGSDCSKKRAPNTSDIEVKVVIPEGLVWTINKRNPHVKLWEYKFKSPIVSVWKENDDVDSADKFRLKEVNLFDNIRTSDFASNPALYLAMHERQLYIQENPLFGRTALKDKFPMSSIGQVTLYPWRPYPAIAFEETTTTSDHKELALVSPEILSTTAMSVLYNSEYINGHGFFLYSNVQLHDPINTQCIEPAIEGVNFTEDIILGDNETESDEETPVQIIIVSIWYYWKEIFVISVSTAIILNCMIDSKLNVLRRKAKETVLEGPVADGHLDVRNIVERKISFSEDETNFQSRFFTDFDPITRLGKGGFGIVFEAKNKIDDCHYAIKRITLPNSQDSRERVMREVKALAKLEHHNIVRYFNAWLECPPIGWQEEQDRLLRQNGVIPTESEFTHEPSHTETGTETKPTSSVENTRCDSAVEARELSDCNGVDDDDDDDFIQFRNSDDEEETDVETIDSRSVSTENSQVSKTDSDEGLQMKAVLQNGAEDSESIVFEYSKNDKEYDGDDEVDRICSNTKDKLSMVDSIVEERPKARQKSPRMYLYIQMQLCQRRSLRDWLKLSETSRDLGRAINIFQQIVDAVEYVHLKGLIHRDLKPSNIFFAFDDKIKIGDFGLVTALPDSTPSPIQLECFKLNEQSNEVLRTAEVGTQLYMSPEQMNGQIYNYKVDIYSLGIILFELLTPFSTDMERMKALTNLRRSVFPENFAIQYPAEYDLLRLMLDGNPKKRPTTYGIKARPPFCDGKPVDKLSVSSDSQWHFELPPMSRHSSSSNTDSNNSAES